MQCLENADKCKRFTRRIVRSESPINDDDTEPEPLKKETSRTRKSGARPQEKTELVITAPPATGPGSTLILSMDQVFQPDALDIPVSKDDGSFLPTIQRMIRKLGLKEKDSDSATV
jgi:hypothetical protein